MMSCAAFSSGIIPLLLSFVAAPALSAGPGASSVADIPLEGQFAVSGTLGRESPAYHAVAIGGGYRIENAVQQLSATFAPSGLVVAVDSDRCSIVLTAFGYGDERTSISQVEPRVLLNRVEYRHGPLTEWYVNGPLGLQQGFTLDMPPGNAGGGPLTLELALGGSLEPTLEDSGRTLMLRQQARQAILKYHGLMAFDATGRPLPAWLELDSANVDRTHETAVLLRVNDLGAQYPLTIDPFIQQAKFTASERTPGDVFGHSVAISGDTVVVGAPYDDALRGSAYVFVKPPTGWATVTETARLTASDGVASDQFGYCVAISGDTIIVGAVGVSSFRGSAYVFEKPETGWEAMTETATLTASDGASWHYFGNSVAISDDTVVVGAQYGDSFRGSAYIFQKPETGWTTSTETAKLTASDGAVPATFGIHVAISGDTVVVGAKDADFLQGAAYVFVKPETGWVTATETARLTASDREFPDQFGFSVAVSDDTVVVGAWRESFRGAAYVFVKPETGWESMTETAKLTASDGSVFDQLGISVAISGNTIVAGAWNNENSRGSVYVFVKTGDGWASQTESAQLTASDRASGDHFGTAVDILGDTVVVGGYGDDRARGSAYVFSNTLSNTDAARRTPVLARPTRTSSTGRR